MTDDEYEAGQHQVLDANLARLRRTDADLDRIFEIGFTEAHRTGRGDQLRRQLETYAAATHAAGRLLDYHRLFAGTD
ncbi:hypothetical protein ACWCXH_14380 [Kitasatospora sp. NPDC001660]